MSALYDPTQDHRVTALEADNAALRKLLREATDDHPCYICGGWGPDNHAADCRLDAALTEDTDD